MNSLLEKLKSMDKKVLVAVIVGAVLIIAGIIGIIAAFCNDGDEENISSSAESNISSESEISDDSSLPSKSEPDESSSPDSEDSSEPEISEPSDDSSDSSEDSSDETTDEPSQSEDPSESSEPDVSEPDNSSEPDVSEPDVSSRPETSSKPESSTPVTSKPESSEPSVSEPESSEPVSSEPDNSEPDISEPDTSEPETEILGSGTEDDPYLAIPDATDNMSVTTIDIPANQSVYYGIYRVGGMILTINNSDAYVVYNGTTYTAENGKVSFQVGTAMASEGILFEIGNNGSSAQSFEITFANITGSYANPVTVSNLSNEYTVSLESGDSDGHYYKYVAEKNGTVCFYMTASADSVMVVTNNRNSAQRTTEGDVKTDSDGNEYIEIEVQQGDEIIINVGAKPNKRGKYPAATITWSAKYN